MLSEEIRCLERKSLRLKFPAGVFFVALWAKIKFWKFWFLNVFLCFLFASRFWTGSRYSEGPAQYTPRDPSKSRSWSLVWILAFSFGLSLAVQVAPISCSLWASIDFWNWLFSSDFLMFFYLPTCFLKIFLCFFDWFWECFCAFFVVLGRICNHFGLLKVPSCRARRDLHHGNVRCPNW